MIDAVAKLDHGQGELKCKSVTVNERQGRYDISLKATLEGDIYIHAMLSVSTERRSWEASFGEFSGPRVRKQAQLNFQIDKKDVDLAVFSFSGGCGEWLPNGVIGQSSSFFQATNLFFLNKPDAEPMADSNRP